MIGKFGDIWNKIALWVDNEPTTDDVLKQVKRSGRIESIQLHDRKRQTLNRMSALVEYRAIRTRAFGHIIGNQMSDDEWDTLLSTPEGRQLVYEAVREDRGRLMDSDQMARDWGAERVRDALRPQQLPEPKSTNMAGLFPLPDEIITALQRRI